MITALRLALSPLVTSALAALAFGSTGPSEAASQLPTPTRFADQSAHALAFGPAGKLYIGKERTVWQITPDGIVSLLAELPASGPELPRVWSLAWHRDHLYAAAHDRIVRIGADGSITPIVEEKFTGPCGVTDLVFDSRGGMYVTYANSVARYGTDGSKTVVLDGTRQPEPPLRWLTSLRIDARGRFWISDVASKRVLQAELNSHGMLEIKRTCQLPEHPEYLAVASDGAVYVGFPDAGTLARLHDDGTHALVPLGGKFEFPVAMEFGGVGFDRAALFVACRNGIHSVRLPAVPPDARVPVR